MSRLPPGRPALPDFGVPLNWRAAAAGPIPGAIPSERGHHVLAVSQHQTAVHDHPEQLFVGAHGELLITCWVDKRVKLAR